VPSLPFLPGDHERILFLRILDRETPPRARLSFHGADAHLDAAVLQQSYQASRIGLPEVIRIEDLMTLSPHANMSVPWPLQVILRSPADVGMTSIVKPSPAKTPHATTATPMTFAQALRYIV
jgi:hypothetical protein